MTAVGACADLAADRIGSLLATHRYGRSLHVVEVTGSTNDDAMQASRTGVANGHVILADHQQGGRGAHGRSWDSPPGSDLYVSIVDRPDVAQSKLPPLTLAVGLGVADACDRLLAGTGAPESRVKWPNDVWIDGRKCAGVLVEATTVGSLVSAVVIGIGLNVNRTEWPAELAGRATSLRELARGGRTFDRAEVLALLLACVERWMERFVADGAIALAGPLDARLAFKGRRVHCEGVEGTLLGIAPTGAARVMTAQGIREVIAGTLLPVEEEAVARATPSLT